MGFEPLSCVALGAVLVGNGGWLRPATLASWVTSGQGALVAYLTSRCPTFPRLTCPAFLQLLTLGE